MGGTSSGRNGIPFLPRHGVEPEIDDDAVDARVGAGGHRGMRHGRRGGQVVDTGTVELRAFASKTAQVRKGRGMTLEIVASGAIQHRDEHHSRCRRIRSKSPGEHGTGGRHRHRQLQQPGDGRRDSLLRHDIAVPAGPDERRTVKDQRNVCVVVPRAAVHVRVVRVGVCENATLSRRDHDLPAAARIVGASEHSENGCAIDRGLRGGSGPARNHERNQRETRPGKNRLRCTLHGVNCSGSPPSPCQGHACEATWRLHDGYTHATESRHPGHQHRMDR